MGALNEVGVTQKGQFNKYGETYELGNELGGLVGFRAVEVNPAKSLKFNPDTRFFDMIDFSKRENYALINNDYGQWGTHSFKKWREGVEV